MDAKDRLIAWAYRFIAQTHGSEGDGPPLNVGPGGKIYGSQELEFFSAAETLVPSVAKTAETVNYHADLAIREAIH